MKKEFPLTIVLTLLTSKSFGKKFDDIHEAIEFVIGHPVWTHEIADLLLWDQLRDNIVEQYPEFSIIDSSLINKENVFLYKEQYCTQFGHSRILTKGTEIRHINIEKNNG